MENGAPPDTGRHLRPFRLQLPGRGVCAEVSASTASCSPSHRPKRVFPWLATASCDTVLTRSHLPLYVPPCLALAQLGVQVCVQLLADEGCQVRVSMADSTTALQAHCRHTAGGSVSTGRPVSCWGSQAWCLPPRQEVAVLSARFQEKPLFCPGAAGGGRRAAWESKLSVRRALPLEPVLQILLCISLSLLLTGHLPHNELHHLPQGLICPWRKRPATASTKSVSLFSCDAPASFFTQSIPHMAPLGPTDTLTQDDFHARGLPWAPERLVASGPNHDHIHGLRALRALCAAPRLKSWLP